MPGLIRAVGRTAVVAGTATAVMRARRRLPSPSSRERNTSSTASRRLATVASMLPRTKSASSTISCRSTPGGNWGASSSRARFTAPLTARALLPSRWKTTTATTASPWRLVATVS